MSFLFRIHIAVLIPFLFITSALEAQDDSMLGFSAESAVLQRQLEARLDEQIDRDNLQKWMERIRTQRMTSHCIQGCRTSGMTTLPSACW